MKINDAGRISGINQYNKTSDNKSSGAGASKARQKDQLQISTEAKEMLSSVQNQKVAELKEAVSTGTYQVDPLKVAEKLLPFLK